MENAHGKSVTRQAQFAGFYLAQENAMFREHGLKVRFKPGGPKIDPMAALEKLAVSTIAELGKLTIWVNNAGGIPDGTPRYLTRTPGDNFDAQIALNLKAVWLGATIAARRMADNGGAIINISSRSAYGPQVKNGPYGAAKAAVNSLTTTLAVEVAPKVRVNAVAPGPIPTENFDDCMGTDTEEKREALLKHIGIPMQRYAEADDIARVMLFLASDDSGFVTGSVNVADGGMTA